MADLKQIVKISKENYEILINGGEVQGYVYNPDALYLIEDTGGSGGGLEEVTYQELVNMRNSGSLTPGKSYRITDYECTTVQEGTQSAGHVFDIIVTADSEDTLNENARAIKHEGDTYFENCDLSAWELKYSIDPVQNKSWSKFGLARIKDWEDGHLHARNVANDFVLGRTQYYAWIDYEGWDIFTTSENPEFEGEYYYCWYCEYEDSSEVDSFNRQSIDVTIDGIQKTYRRNLTLDQVKNGNHDDNYYAWANGLDIVYTYSETPNEGDEVIYGEVEFYFDGSDNNQGVYGAGLGGFKGIILEMTDEYKNHCYYDFKNILFKRYKITSVSKTDLNDLIGKYIGIKDGYQYSYDEDDYKFVYTFGYDTDTTINGESYDNNINLYNAGNDLNNITMGTQSYGNTFGTDCHDNTFGNYIQYNTFGNYVYQNTFGNYIWYNTFGNSVYQNTFGNSVRYNTFGNSVYWNTFGNDVYWNTFGNGVGSNTFGNYVYQNTFGNGVGSNTFGNSVNYNTFGNYFYYNTIENDMQYCEINETTSNSRSMYLMHMHFLNGLKYDRLTTIISGTSHRGKEFCQMVGKNSSGAIIIKNIMDN